MRKFFWSIVVVLFVLLGGAWSLTQARSNCYQKENNSQNHHGNYQKRGGSHKKNYNHKRQRQHKRYERRNFQPGRHGETQRRLFNGWRGDSPRRFWGGKWHYPQGPRRLRGPGWRWDGFQWWQVFLPRCPGPQFCWDYYRGVWVRCGYYAPPSWW